MTKKTYYAHLPGAPLLENWQLNEETPGPEIIKAHLDTRKQQVGGDHYTSLAIQPMEYSMANNLDACQHTIIKYITRFRQKGGIEDLHKAKHCIDMLIQFEGK